MPGHDHHDHGVGGGGHSHGVSPDADRRWLATALGLILGFMAVEIVAGVLADSLALLSDAAHMATDAAAIALALTALRLAARPATGTFTFGFGRAEILSAQVNGAGLLVLAGIIGVEAVRRLFDPPDVEGGLVILVGLLGAGVNVAAAWALSRAERQSLNVQGARQHVLTDLYASLAAAAAGAIVLLAGYREADPIAALVVAGLMLRSGWALLRDSGRILLEGTPAGIDAQAIGRALASEPDVIQVHDLHVWEVTSGFPALAAHVVVAPGADCHDRRRSLQRLLAERFGIEHTTLQVDHAPREQLLSIAAAGEGGR
jgi:cobalt-zinc-cadmium efflux system protein